MEAEWCSARGCGIEQRWTILRHQGRRVLAQTRPHGRDRQHICKVQGVQRDTAHVRVAISRQGSAPCLDSVNVLQAATEPDVLNRLHDQSRGFVQPVPILIQTDHVRGIQGELHVTRLRDPHGLLCIGLHVGGVQVDRAILRPHQLVPPAELHSAPGSAQGFEQAGRLFRVHQYRASIPAVLERQ